MKPLGRHDPRAAGRHQLIAVIGQGAMGRVLLGRSPDGRLVAVEMSHRHLAENPEFRARFRLEVQASQRVTGVHAAAGKRADLDPEYAGFVMNSGPLGDIPAARRINSDGTCATYHLVRPTIEDRGEHIAVIARPTGPGAAEAACAATESVLGGVAARLRSR